MSGTASAARSILKPALLLSGLTAGALSLHLLPFKALLTTGAATGPADAALFVGVGALACAIGVPRQVVAFAAGFVWGATAGAALALLATTIGAAADLFWARRIAREWVQARLGQRLRKFDRRLSARPFSTALALRLLPVGNNLLLNLLAGVSRVPAAGFLAGSVVGFVPQTVIFALLGSGTRIAHLTEILVAGALFAVSALLGVLMLRRPGRLADLDRFRAE